LKISFNRQQLDNEIKEMKNGMTKSFFFFLSASTWQHKCIKYEGNLYKIFTRRNKKIHFPLY